MEEGFWVREHPGSLEFKLRLGLMLGLRLRQVRLGIMAEVGFEVRTRTKVRSGAGIGAGAGEHRYLPCVDS